MDPTALLALDPHPRPISRIEVDGQDITTLVDGRLVILTHTDNRGFEADTVELQLEDTDGMLDLPSRGAEVRVAIGWANTGLVEKGVFTVDDIEHSGPPDILTIRARSADLRGGLTTQRERSWHDVKLGDIVCTIADECDLAPGIADSLKDEAIDHIDQTNESAVNLLTRLAQRFDAIATVKAGKLLFMPAAGGLSVSGKRLPAVTITRASGDTHRFAIADRNAYTAVRALYNDVGKAVKGEVLWGKDENAAEQKQPAAASPAPTTGQFKDLGGKPSASRAAALKLARLNWKKLLANKAARAAYVGVKKAYDDRNLGVAGVVTYGQADEEKKRKNAKKLAEKDAKAGAAAPANAFDHSADNVKTLRHVYASKANAQRAARAEWRRLQRGMASFSITLALGRPDLFPELPVTVRGFKPQIDSTDWIITRVTNTLTADGGYTTTLELEIKATEIPD